MGALRGYRTYIIGWLIVAEILLRWLVGDIGTLDLLHQLPDVLEGLGLVTLRAGIAEHFNRYPRAE